MSDQAPPETFHEALARIKREMAAQPDGDRLGYLKAAVANCTSLPEPERVALFDVLMLLPSQASPSNVTLNVQQNQTANPNVSQIASPTINANQTANPSIVTPPAPASSSAASNRVALSVGILTVIGALAAAVIIARCSTTQGSSKPARDTGRTVRPVGSKSTPPAPKPATRPR